MKLAPEDIEEIARDIPFSFYRGYTNERWVQNDYYGIATDLKKYAEIPPDTPLDCIIEHGVYFRSGSDQDLSSGARKIITMGDFRKKKLKSVTNRRIFMIGPPIFYSDIISDELAIRKKKKKIGKNLLAFPAHSAHAEDVSYDIDSYCDYLKKLQKRFNKIRVCLYWKDVLIGMHKEYSKRGFECVCAGHVFDKTFNSRLKEMILLSSATSSNTAGSILGYSVLFKKPHFIFPQKVTIARGRRVSKMSQIEIKLIETFSSSQKMNITDYQRKLVDQVWGLSKTKSKHKLREILIK